MGANTIDNSYRKKINRSNRRLAIDGTKRANHGLASLHDTRDVEYVRKPPFSPHEILTSLQLVTSCTCVCRALTMAYRPVIYCKVSCECGNERSSVWAGCCDFHTCRHSLVGTPGFVLIVLREQRTVPLVLPLLCFQLDLCQRTAPLVTSLFQRSHLKLIEYYFVY